MLYTLFTAWMYSLVYGTCCSVTQYPYKRMATKCSSAPRFTTDNLATAMCGLM